ncbi:class I SAM-dependent methyltransferase, partial [Pseudonocardia sp. KRD291]|uniref:class I SAM-dependent methyltransferase n=1 Tax=Pseudonocardia sp. KRD291 TaxID=2792007 RepID=UPI001C49EF6D
MDEGPRGWGVPLHEQVLSGLEPGAPMLDVGCGAGAFTAFAAGRGWTVSGADTDRSALAAAERELPDSDLRLADAHDLPWPGDAFGLVTLVQVLAHVTNPIAALREAARVCEPGGRVRATVWGRPDECDVGGFGRALAPFLPDGPAPSRGSAGPPPLTEPDRLRKVAGLAGLDVRDLHEVVCTFDYADADELVGPVLDSALGRRAMMRSSGPRPVRRALLAGMEPFREGTGYRLHNT